MHPRTWKQGATLALVFSALSCGDHATLPTEGGTGNEQPAQLIRGDSLRLTRLRPSSTPGSCIELPESDFALQKQDVYVCLPVAKHKSGIKKIVVQGFQRQGDPLVGGGEEIEVYEPYEIPGLKNSPLKETVRLVPKLTPNDKQKSGKLRIQVTLHTAEDKQAVFSLHSEIRERPGVSIVSPEADTEFKPGTMIQGRLHLENPEGVSTVNLAWSGVLNKAESLRYSPALKDDTVAYSLTLPDSTKAGDLKLLVTATDTKGLSSEVSRTFKIVATPVDSVAPVIQIADLPSSTLESGSQISVSAQDGSSGVQRLGIALLSEDLKTTLLVDSITQAKPGTRLEHTFTLNLPMNFRFGPLKLAVFAHDGAGNSGWIKTGEPAVKNISEASTTDVQVVAGQTSPFATATSLRSGRVHQGRSLVLFANSASNANRIEVFNYQTMKFETPIYVGSNPSTLAFVQDAAGRPTARVVVGNQGGTDLSIVDLDRRAQVARLPIPGLIVEATHLKKFPDGGAPDTTETFRISDRPADMTVGCQTSACTAHTIFLTNQPTFQNAYSVTRAIPLLSNNTLGQVDIATPPYKDVHYLGEKTAWDSATVSVYLVDRTNGDLPRLFTRQAVSLTATVYKKAPQIGMDARGLATLYIGEEEGASLDTINSRMLHVDPRQTWATKPTATQDYTRNSDEFVQDILVNEDGSQMLVLTPNSTLILNGTLNRLGALDLSGSPAAATFLAGHNASTREARDGGLVAVAPKNGKFIDVYDTSHYRLLARFPLRDRVIGTMAFLRTSTTGDLALIATTASGVVVHRTSIDDLITRGQTVFTAPRRTGRR